MNASDSAWSGSSSTTITRPSWCRIIKLTHLWAWARYNLTSLVILAIVLIIFGPRKLGDIGKALGQGVRELKKGADLGGDGSASRHDRDGDPVCRICLRPRRGRAPDVAQPCPSRTGSAASAAALCGI
jgi:TatA/E family protein of Tat protein translocase